MRSSFEQRAIYHPRTDGSVRPGRGQRDSRARLRLIESNVDFAGKTVLDLGCSGGFFSLSLASQAKRVIAVDADPDIIEENQREAKRLGYSNIEFIHAHIEPAFVTTLSHVDITLFLSVFHHILVASDFYDWNSVAGEQQAMLLLKRIGQLADTYVFEMGEPWEPRAQWADGLGAKVGDLQKWIPTHVFGAAYKSIQALPGPAYQHWPFARWPGLAGIACRTRVGRTLLRQAGIHPSDFRTLYIGQRG